MDSHAETIEKQKERIRDLQTEREVASSAASTAREQVNTECFVHIAVTRPGIVLFADIDCGNGPLHFRTPVSYAHKMPK